MSNRTLGSGFLRSAEMFPERTALEVDEKAWSYAALKSYSAALAATLTKHQPEAEPKLTAVLAHRSVSAFGGILAALLRGHGYVPVNPNFPSERIVTVLERSGCGGVVVGAEAVAKLPEVLNSVTVALTLYFPENDDVSELIQEFDQHRFVTRKEFCDADDWLPVVPADESTAYLLFTSGSTGVPKGVQVSHSNIRHFIDVMVERYAITEEDRFSQMFELVFDLSLFDIFMAWECGACLCCPNKGDAQLPARYINESRITVWFSVPSLAVAMAKMRMLQPGLYPQLRLSLFCGEALLADTIEAWSIAAPNSQLENLYGPTEVTLACTYYHWEHEQGKAESLHGSVPIGYPYPGMDAIIVDEDLNEIADGEDGELLMCGPQVAIGYWNDAEKTAAAFVVPPGKTARYYRTGDLVRRTSNAHPIEYRGRIDHQVKIRGNRVELGEIEAVLRSVEGVEQAIAVGWPRTASGIDGVAAFLHAPDADLAAVRARASDKLPSYMVPKRYQLVDDMPLNQNGKIDRNALVRILQTGAA